MITSTSFLLDGATPLYNQRLINTGIFLLEMIAGSLQLSDYNTLSFANPSKH
jgi:hypothetical protein